MMDHIKYLWHRIYLPVRYNRLLGYVKSPKLDTVDEIHVYEKRGKYVVWHETYGKLFEYTSNNGFHLNDELELEVYHKKMIFLQACTKTRHLLHNEILVASVVSDEFQILLREHHLEIHNWLIQGNKQYRIQCFQQFSYFMLGEWRIHAALVNKIHLPARKFDESVSLYKTKECSNRDFSSRIDMGESPLTVLSDALSLPVWMIRQMRNDGNLGKKMVETPLRVEHFFGVIYFIGQCGHPDIIQNLEVSDIVNNLPWIPSVLTQNNIISRNILNKMQNEGGLVAISGDIPLSKLKTIRFGEIADAIQNFGNFTNRFDFDLDDAVSKFSHLFPDIRTLIRLSNDWHEQVSPHLSAEKIYVWEYDFTPISVVVDNHTYVCTPLTSTAELIKEGKSQHHCVASRNEKCVSGESIIFSIRGPHDSTIEFNNQGDVIEHKMKRNEKPNLSLIKVEKHLRAALLSNHPSGMTIKNVRLVGGNKSTNDVSRLFWEEKFPEIADYLYQHPRKEPDAD